MKRIIKLDHDDVRMILAEKFNTPKSSVVIELDTIHHEVSAEIHINEKVETSESQLYKTCPKCDKKMGYKEV